MDINDAKKLDQACKNYESLSRELDQLSRQIDEGMKSGKADPKQLTELCKRHLELAKRVEEARKSYLELKRLIGETATFQSSLLKDLERMRTNILSSSPR
jgi:hypothetical protein